MLATCSSDLHLELLEDSLPSWVSTIGDPGCTVCILAGDIGNPFNSTYATLLDSLSSRFNHVIIVAGNHEYYNEVPMAQVEKQIQQVISNLPHSDRVHFLNRSTVEIEGIRFVGCTLWSNINSLPVGSCLSMNDFFRIQDLSISDDDSLDQMKCKYQELYRKDLHWLEDCLAEEGNWKKTVVITHYLPSYRMIAPRYKNHPLTPFFSSCLDHLVKKANFWFCGHSHSATKTVIGNCTCILNPRGYEGEETDWNPHLTVDLLAE